MATKKENKRRCDRAERALLQYHDEDGYVVANVTDLLADLRHFCERNKIDFSHRDACAYEHYIEENGKHQEPATVGATRRSPSDTPMDLTPLLKEPDCKIQVSRHELLKMCIEADKALDGDSNDAEHDALYSIRGALSEFLEDPIRRRYL